MGMVIVLAGMKREEGRPLKGRDGKSRLALAGHRAEEHKCQDDAEDTSRRQS